MVFVSAACAGQRWWGSCRLVWPFIAAPVSAAAARDCDCCLCLVSNTCQQQWHFLCYTLLAFQEGWGEAILVLSSLQVY
jgi:hypothetical protein